MKGGGAVFHSDKISLLNLLVNPENYRYENEVASQKEAIDNMIHEQGDKLFKLAEHIIKNGLNPLDITGVAQSSHDKTKYIVLEGNRRIICLKILQNPDLIDIPRYTNLKKKFRKLHDDNKTQLIVEIDCVVFDDPAKADEWIKLKHVGESDGRGTVRWNAQQVQRFEQKVEGKSSLALQAIDFLKKANSVSDTLKSNLGNLKITNLNRLLSDPDVRASGGISVNNGKMVSDIEEGEVSKWLSKVANDLLAPDFKVGDIYTKDDRRDYISGFPSATKPNTSKKASQPWELAKGTIKASGTYTRPYIDSSKRKHLIPKSFKIKICNPKVNSIYLELQRIDIKFKNAVAVLFRAFMELSVECFLEKHTVPKLNDRSYFVTKITEIAGYLEKNKLAKKNECKPIKTYAHNPNHILGVDTWHAYVHNPKFTPRPEDLNNTWDGVQDYVRILWENIK